MDKNFRKLTAEIEFAAVVSMAVLTSVWTMQLAFGVVPCHLCLYERVPYYAGFVVASIAGTLLRMGRARAAAPYLVALIGVVFAISTGVGVYHFGMEQHWWQGPASCSSQAIGTLDPKALWDALQSDPSPLCDKVSLRVFGISLAGWNTLLSFALATSSVASLMTWLRRGTQVKNVAVA